MIDKKKHNVSSFHPSVQLSQHSPFASSANLIKDCSRIWLDIWRVIEHHEGAFVWVSDET